MAFLSQALHLGYLLSPHSAFQGHAAHTTGWSAMLSPNGSSDTCISDGVFHIPMPCFHGAPPPAHSARPVLATHGETACGDRTHHRVAYPGAADNLSGPLPFRLRRLNQPVISSRHGFSASHLAPLARI